MKFARPFFLLALLLPVALRAADSPWQRVIMIGASASAGFVLSEPFGGTNTTECKLSYYLDAAIAAPHPPVRNLSTALLFLNPDTFAPMQVSIVTNSHPTLVIAVDFMFWFCYGDGATDADRARHFESGLKLLDKIPGPLVVGDVPDASAAATTGIISDSQVPSETARLAANKRLREWAKARGNVVVVPLADFMRHTMANQAVAFHGQTVPEGKTRSLLQPDLLHPNPRGAAMLTLAILDTLTTQNSKFPAKDIRWKANEVYRLGWDSAQAAIRAGH